MSTRMIRILFVAGLAATLSIGLLVSGGLADAGRGATGTITGVVELAGKAPARTQLDRSSDPFCARHPQLSEKVIATQGKLQDVHVRIKNGTAGKHKPPATAVRIEQQRCMYRPRVAGIMEGQALQVSNGDSTFHNVHGRRRGAFWFNLSQPAKAPAIVRTDVGKAGEVATLKCDVHPWMRAYLPITDHPFFDVTDKSGSFTIAGVPAGVYTLEAWHPELGITRKKVRVKRGKTSRVVLRLGK